MGDNYEGFEELGVLKAQGTKVCPHCGEDEPMKYINAGVCMYAHESMCRIRNEFVVGQTNLMHLFTLFFVIMRGACGVFSFLWAIQGRWLYAGISLVIYVVVWLLHRFVGKVADKRTVEAEERFNWEHPKFAAAEKRLEAIQ